MKKSFRIIASVFAIVAAASCAKETPVENPSDIIGGETVPFELSIVAEGQTKASFDSSVRQLAWQEGDQVAVFDGTAKQIFTVNAASIDGGSAVFSGEITAGAQNLYVAYPVEAAGAASAEGVSVTIPSVQTVPAGDNSDPEAFVMVGKVAEDNSVELKNVISLVKCTLEEAASSISIMTDGALSGEVTANPLTGASTAASASSVTVNGSFAAGSSVYVAVAPTTVEGFKVVLRNESGRMVKSTDKTATFKQNGILSIGTVDEGAVAVPDAISNYDEYKSFVENYEYYGADDVVRVIADIDMAGKTVTPVPTFSGTFDGENHVLSNITIANTAEVPVGLFSVLTGATVQNLTLENINVSSTYVEVGAVAGNATDCMFKNITVTGGESSTITTTASLAPTPTDKYGTLYTNTYSVVGGIVGSVTGGEISDCTFGGKAIADGRAIAGIAGFVASAPIVIKDCSHASGALVSSVKATNVGGIVGISVSSDLKLSGCHCLGTVFAAYSYVGGIAGSVISATVKDCDATGASVTETATSSGSVGAIVSYADGGTVCFENCTVDGCTIKGGFGLGGILGHSGSATNTSVSIKGCHVKNGTTLTALHTSAYTGGLVGRTNTKTQNLTISDSDVKNCILAASAGGQLGGLIGCSQAASSTISNCVSYGNSVTCDAATAYCAGIIGCQYGANITLTDCTAENVTLKATAATNSNSAFFIGRPTSGANKVELINPTVKNCTLTAPKGQTNGGLVGYLDGANLIVKNAVLEGITIDCARRYVGGVVGNVVNTVKTVVVDGLQLSSSTIKVVGNVDNENQNYTGGVIGYMSGSVTEATVKNAVVSGTTLDCNRAYVGGLFGTSGAKSVIIENCVVGSGCTIKGSYSIGGITGGAFFGNGSVMKVDGCTCYANVTATSNQVGGIVGLVNNNALTTPASVSITNCSYLDGTLKTTHAGNAMVGGIIGKCGGFTTAGADNRAKIYVVNCCSRPGAMTATRATVYGETTVAYVGGITGHIHSGTSMCACYSDMSSSNVTANSHDVFPIWGVAEDFANWYNFVDNVYYGNGFTLPGFFVNEDDAMSVNSEAVNFTNGSLLTKLNAAAAAYNSAPLLAGTTAGSWVAGLDGYPALAAQIADPDM